MTQYPNGPQYPQFQPGGPVPPQPKKKHTLRTVLLVVGAVFAVLIVVGALAGSPEPEAPTAVESMAPAPVKTTALKTTAPKPTAPKTTQAAPKVACAGQDDRNAPCTVTVGRPFQLGKHTVLSWKVVSEYGSMSITGKAKNTGDASSTMFVEIKFLKGDEVVADVTCTTDALEPGQTQALSCFGTDSYTRKYDRVTAEAMF